MPPLVFEAYNIRAVENNLIWVTQSKSPLDRLGFSEAWIELGLMNPTSLMCEVKDRLTHQYIQSWRQMLRDSMGTFKHDYNNGSLYILTNLPVTKFNAHSLRIKIGQYALPRPGER